MLLMGLEGRRSGYFVCAMDKDLNYDYKSSVRMPLGLVWIIPFQTLENHFLVLNFIKIWKFYTGEMIIILINDRCLIPPKLHVKRMLVSFQLQISNLLLCKFGVFRYLTLIIINLLAYRKNSPDLHKLQCLNIIPKTIDISRPFVGIRAQNIESIILTSIILN